MAEPAAKIESAKAEPAKPELPKIERQNATAVKPVPSIETRRFQLPDLNEHGPWLIERLLKIYQQGTATQVYTRLHSQLYATETLFLYQKTAVSVAQVVVGNVLTPRPTIQEWFTFVKDPGNAQQIEHAAGMYADMLRWAKANSAEAIVLSQYSDVPPELAKPHLGGRLLERHQVFVKVDHKGG